MARLAAIWLALIACLAVTPAFAQPGPTAADKATARDLVRSGRVKKRRGNLDGALEDFAAAHALMGVPTTGLELGKAQADSGMLVEALDTFLGVVRLPTRRGEARAFRRARKEAKQRADKLKGRVPSLRVAVDGTAAEGASVSIDGREQPPETVGAPIKVNPGKHEVAAESGDVRESVTVEVEEGETRAVTLTLNEVVEAPAAETQPDSADTRINPMVWAGFGVGAAGLIVGTVTGSLAIAQFSDVGPRCPDNRCPPDVHDDVDSGKTLGTVSTVGFIAGGVGVAVGVVGLFLPLESDDEDDDEAGVALRVGPASISLGGRF